jgi:hypothetical protein
MMQLLKSSSIGNKRTPVEFSPRQRLKLWNLSTIPLSKLLLSVPAHLFSFQMQFSSAIEPA